MPKRATLDPNQFKINLPKPRRDPLESVIPTTPSSAQITTPPPTVKKEVKQPTAVSQHRDAKHGTVIPRHHDVIIESIRSAVKTFGKEAATHRFTLEEKKAIADIVYTYRNQNVKTNENELARIAINFVISDYKENGENSILSQALRALNS